ncbi:MAG: hypothetical protein IJP28_06815 [Erysipelotrichales bacterium]|nr:hypothetical protein [Erysipelotrichales bacterium]MBR3693989.1 hypothetical protein [Erysipelotrichales bacterium]
MRELSLQEMSSIKGREAVTLTGVLLYVAVGAGVSAIIKVLTSGKGRVKIPGISMEWS